MSPLAPLPSVRNPTPNQSHQHRAEECEEFLQHICSLLCTFSPPWDENHAAGHEDTSTLLNYRRAQRWAAGGNETRIKAIWLTDRGDQQELQSAEWVSHLERSFCHSASTTKIRSFIFVMAPAGGNLSPEGGLGRPGKQLIHKQLYNVLKHTNICTQIHPQVPNYQVEKIYILF